MSKLACTAILSVAVSLSAATGCYTTSTHTRTVSAANAEMGTPGTVSSIREVVRHTEGNPGAGAVAGALIGGVLFHGSVGSTLFGATAGGATGALLSSGRSERRAYEVRVMFDDGNTGVFTYADYSPFRPGDRVVLVENGLARM